MKSCPECQTQYDATTEFCPKDGARLLVANDTDDAFIGRVIGGKYRIIEKLGGGGMGVVYKAEHSYLGNFIALKVLRSHLAHSSEYLQRFQREARTASKIRHPHAVILHDFGIEENFPYLAMEFIEGKTLREILDKTGALSLPRTYTLVTQISGALAEAHSHGIIHRDLKPDNILVSTEKNGKDWSRVFDFGIAKVMEVEGDANTQLTRHGIVFGSPRYMSPEQALGKQIDVRSDLYSLGAMIYEILVNRAPFETTSVMETMLKHVTDEVTPLRTIRPEASIPEALDRCVLKLLAKDPNDRYQNIQEFLTDFEKAMEGIPGVTGSGSYQVAPRSKFVPIALGATMVAVLAIVSYGVFSGKLSSPNTKNLEEEVKKLEALKAESQAEAAKAAELARKRQAEAEAAAKLAKERQEEAERLKQNADQAMLEMENIKELQALELKKVDEIRAELGSIVNSIDEKRKEVAQAAVEAEKIRAAQAEEARLAELLKQQAEEATRLVEEKRKQAAQITQEVASQRAAREEEERRAAELRAQAELAAKKVETVKADLEAAQAKKSATEQALSAALVKKQEAERILQTSKPDTVAKKDTVAVKTAPLDQKALEEAEAKRTAALEAARLAEQRRIQAEAAAKKAELERRQAEEAAARAKAEEEEKQKALEAAAEEQNSRTRRSLSREGKRRM